MWLLYVVNVNSSFLKSELLMFLKLQITIICIEEYMLFVNYVLDLNNGFKAKVVVEESKDIYLEYMDYKSITMKCTKLRTPSY